MKKVHFSRHPSDSDIEISSDNLCQSIAKYVTAGGVTSRSRDSEAKETRNFPRTIRTRVTRVTILKYGCFFATVAISLSLKFKGNGCHLLFKMRDEDKVDIIGQFSKRG